MSLPVVPQVWERMRRIGSPLHTADDAEKYLRGVEVSCHGVQQKTSLTPYLYDMKHNIFHAIFSSKIYGPKRTSLFSCEGVISFWARGRGLGLLCVCVRFWVLAFRCCVRLSKSSGCYVWYGTAVFVRRVLHAVRGVCSTAEYGKWCGRQKLPLAVCCAGCCYYGNAKVERRVSGPPKYIM